jgi:Ca2+-binding RTX toxin-like protein
LLYGGDAEDGLNGEGGDDTLYGGFGFDAMSGGDGNDLLYGGDDDDQDDLWGNLGDDALYGGEGADMIFGGEGNDTIFGGSTDTLYGGLNDDTYVVNTAPDFITEAADEGTDEVKSSVTYTLGDNLETLTLTGTGTIDGTGNGLSNLITGNSGNNALFGGEGDDTIFGGEGDDTIFGGLGSDTFFVDSVFDTVVEDDDAGTDTAKSLIDYILTDHVEILHLTGESGINGTGNGWANQINGNIGDNILAGLGGSDTLRAGAGQDSLYGVRCRVRAGRQRYASWRRGE